MSIVRYFSYIALFILLGSCQEVIELDLPNSDPQLVIEGELIRWVEDPERDYAQVTISATGNYYDEEAFTPVSEALVQIEDLNAQQVYDLPLQENQPGVYQSREIPVMLGNQYQLRVEYEGNLYQAEGTVLPVAELDSFSYRFREETLLLEEGYYFFFSGRTPKERGINYYRFKIYEDDSLYNEPEDYLIQSDELLQADIDTLQLANYAFDLGDSVRIEMFSLNKDVFNYYNQLVELLFNDGGLFSPPPRNPDTNIINVSNPNLPPLGFFQVSSALDGGAIVRGE